MRLIGMVMVVSEISGGEEDMSYHYYSYTLEKGGEGRVEFERGVETS